MERFRCIVFLSTATLWVQSLSVASQSGTLDSLPARRGGQLYLEVAALKGSNAGDIETKLLKKYAPGQSTYKLVQGDRVAQDNAFKTQALNFFAPPLSRAHDFCKTSAPCVKSWLDSADGTMYAQMDKLYHDALIDGCTQVGGCRAEVLGTLNWHVERAHNILYESSDWDWDGWNERVKIVQRNPNYKKLLVVVATNYSTLASRQFNAAVSSQQISQFMANPRAMSAPLLTNPQTHSLKIQQFVCGMTQVLDCLSSRSATFMEPSGAPQPCGSSFEGMYVIDHTQSDDADLVAIAMKGGSKDDRGFLNARGTLAAMLPPGATPCQIRAAAPPTAKSLFRFFR